MLTGINIYEIREFVSRYDPDKNNPTKFIIGMLDPYVRAYIEDATTSFEVSSSNPDDAAKASFNMSKRNLLAIKFGLRGVENFLDPQTNKPVKFGTISKSVGGKNYNIVSDNIIAMFSKELRVELAEEILNENILSGEEEKN